MPEQTAQDFADIERARDQPPDEPYPTRTGAIPRCEACELEAARRARAAELGVSEWEAFIDAIPPCDECKRLARLLGQTALNRCHHCGSSDICADERIHETFIYCRDCGAVL